MKVPTPSKLQPKIRPDSSPIGVPSPSGSSSEFSFASSKSWSYTFATDGQLLRRRRKDEPQSRHDEPPSAFSLPRAPSGGNSPDTADLHPSWSEPEASFNATMPPTPVAPLEPFKTDKGTQTLPSSIQVSEGAQTTPPIVEDLSGTSAPLVENAGTQTSPPILETLQVDGTQTTPCVLEPPQIDALQVDGTQTTPRVLEPSQSDATQTTPPQVEEFATQTSPPIIKPYLYADTQTTPPMLKAFLQAGGTQTTPPNPQFESVSLVQSDAFANTKGGTSWCQSSLNKYCAEKQQGTCLNDESAARVFSAGKAAGSLVVSVLQHIGLLGYGVATAFNSTLKRPRPKARVAKTVGFENSTKFLEPGEVAEGIVIHGDLVPPEIVGVPVIKPKEMGGLSFYPSELTSDLPLVMTPRHELLCNKRCCCRGSDTPGKVGAASWCLVPNAPEGTSEFVDVSQAAFPQAAAIAALRTH